MTSRYGRMGVMALALVAMLALAVPASAELMLNVTSASVGQGQTGYVEVYWSGATTEQLFMYNFALDVTKSGLLTNDVQFIQAGSGLSVDHSPLFNTGNLGFYNDWPTNEVMIADDRPSATAITNNSGLVRIAFQAGSQSGVYPLVFNPEMTNFVGAGGVVLTPTFGLATITVTPEPSTLVLLAIGLVGMVYAWRKRK